MYDDSKRAKRIVEDVTEGIAETSSIYVKGYSDSNVASLSVVKSGERQGVSNRLAFNDSNKTSEVYHIRASHDNPIDIGFDIRNAKVKKNGSDLELFLPGNRQVIICDYFRNLESLPNIVFAGTIILTGEEFLCVFAHTLYTWYREVKHRATVHIQHTMSDIVKTVKNIRKKISYQSTESDVTNSKFWNSLSVIDNTPVANEDMPIHTDIERIEGEISSIQESLHTMSEYCTQNTLELKDRIDKNTEYMSSVVEQMQGVEYHTVISKIYNEVGLLRNSIEQIQSMIGSFQGTTEHKRYRNESNNEIIPRLSLLEETVNNLVHTVESIHSIVHSIQNEAMLSKPCSHDLENILSEIASIKHTVHLLEQQLGNVHNRNTQEALSTTLRSYTELLQDELQTLRSYVDTVSNECKHTDILPTQDISRHLSEVESAIYRSLSKIKTMQGNIAGQKESIRTEAVPLYSELNGIKKNLEEFQVMVESIRSSIVKDTSSIGDNVDYIANELVSMSARLRQLNTYIDTVDTKIHSLFEVNEIGENKDNQGGVVHQGLEEEYNTLSKLPAEEEVYRVHEDSIPESNEEYIDALYTDENTEENQTHSIST
ncbi:MAG: hypothetical protein K2M30_03905 [Desulfovibrionaceae bacterium]|nr:hypothetical protein [Desulfovibrionaceae bacterium]